MICFTAITLFSFQHAVHQLNCSPIAVSKRDREYIILSTHARNEIWEIFENESCMRRFAMQWQNIVRLSARMFYGRIELKFKVKSRANKMFWNVAVSEPLKNEREIIFSCIFWALHKKYFFRKFTRLDGINIVLENRLRTINKHLISWWEIRFSK
jgi:hypothetical protein